MRLFTAVTLPQEILLRLERLIHVLRPEALVKWSPLDNLHITTKFIGEWPDVRLEELDSCLRELTARRSFEVEISELGWFPNERSPRVLWAGVRGGDSLKQLGRDTEEGLAAIGVKRDEREYSPHLTLARLKSPVPLRGLKQRVQELQPAAIGSFTASEFTLFRSDPGSNASLYRALGQYRFEVAHTAAGHLQ